jgi:alpha-galactosidase
MAIKIAIIGAGSLSFTRTLVRDILCVPELRDSTFALMDIHPGHLDRVASLVRREIEGNGFPAKVLATTERAPALEGAGYVISVVRVGGLDAFATDVEIPLKYGVDQCVGDTLCAGGILYAQRNIPVIVDLCRDIRAHAVPGALFMNYANPMAMNCWAAARAGAGVWTVGLCHGVQGGHWQLSQVIQLLVNKGKKPGSRGYTPVTVKDVDIICAGINHQTWYTQVRYRGEDWTPRLLEGFMAHPRFAREEKVRIDMLRRFGYYSTESNGHLSEYVPWYRKRRKDISKWIDKSVWIHGESGGYLRYCREGREDFERSHAKLLSDPVVPIDPAKRSNEHGSHIIEALETGRVYRGHFNLPNCGCIANLPDDAIVEAPGYVDRNGISTPRVGDLPLGCAAVCNVSVSVQRLAVEAALAGDVALLKQAVMMDPLTGAVCDPDEISLMVDEMLVAGAAWLPQYRDALPAARARLRKAKRK